MITLGVVRIGNGPTNKIVLKTDFDTALHTIVPASQRSQDVIGQPLSNLSKPLLTSSLETSMKKLHNIFTVMYVLLYILYLYLLYIQLLPDSFGIIIIGPRSEKMNLFSELW